MRLRRCLCLGAMAAALFLAGPGCGSSAMKLIKVRGKVTLDGQPVANATVQFEPVDPSTGQRPASGRTGPDGIFTLTTNISGDGAMAGKYKVTIAKPNETIRPKPAGNTTDPQVMLQMTKEQYAERRKNMHPPRPLPNELPEEYGSLEKTPLSAEVPSAAYDFALGKAGGR